MKTFIKLWDHIYESSSLLAITGALHLGIFVLSFLAFQSDSTIWMGQNVWIKPMKFAISIAIYCWTISALIDLYPYEPHKKRFMANMTALFMGIEMVAIGLQAFRGVGSHFNTETVFDSAVFSTMALAIIFNTCLVLLLTADSFRLRLNTNIEMQWAIRLGWLAMLIASVAGGMMSSRLQHSVGVPDGGAGLPFLNWSTEGGDLRVAHFVGMHGLQMLPLLAFSFFKGSFFAQYGKYIIISVGILYIGFVCVLLVQAMMGRPLL